MRVRAIPLSKVTQGELTRKYDRHTEEEEDTGNRESVLGSLGVNLTVDDGFADQRNRDADRSPEKWLASPDPVDEEDDEDEIWKDHVSAIDWEIAETQNLLARGPMQL